MGGYYFYRSDRKVIIVLLAIILLLVAALIFLGNSNSQTRYVDDADTVAVDTLKKQAASQPQYYAVPIDKPELFYFDPNTADSTQLLRLGLQPWQVRNIYKYRAKGGIYRKPKDFARLYGLTVKQYKALEPYIRISSDYQPASSLADVSDTDTIARDTLRYPRKISLPATIILNTADTTQLKSVPGIGSYYARAIVGYGQRLGGYVCVEQLSEIEDFPTEAIKYFTIEEPVVRKINLNRLKLRELRKHPYISYYQAKTIIDYRRLYGPLKSLDDLALSEYFPQQAIDRLKPYIEF